MLNEQLNKIKIMFIMFFLIGSSIFYLFLYEYHYEEANQLIQENVLFSDAMHKFISKSQKPAIYKLIKENNMSKDFFDPAMMSSTFIISQVHNIFKDEHPKGELSAHEHVEFKFASDNPTNPLNKADAFESEVLKKFNTSNIKSYTQNIKRNGKDTVFFAVPTTNNTQSCLKCHGDPKDAPKEMITMYGDKNGFNENLGEIRAINSVYSTIDANNNMLYFFLIIELLMMIIFFSIYFVVRYFVIQLNEKDNLIAKQTKFAAMGEMTSMIAHQWRQPLTGVSMITSNLLLDIELKDIDEKRLKDSLETVNTQIEYLSHTIDDFKNFFKPDLKSQLVDINKLIDESCMIIDSSLRGNGIKVEKNYLDEISTFTKKNDIMQIILNLLKNSIDAYIENNIQDRVINITTNKTKYKVTIQIKDNAGGIPADILEKIFDPYFSTKDQKNGTGLGLYMSKMIVESHLEGQLLVQTKDKSTTFSITIPIQEAI